MNKVVNLISRKLSVFLLLSFVSVFVFVVLWASSALGAAETYSLSIRCDAAETPNTYKICKIADVDGNFDTTIFDLDTYKTNHPETQSMTDQEVIWSIQQRLKDNNDADIGELARLTTPQEPCPTITSDFIDPTPVTLDGGTYILISDTACPLIIGLNDYMDSNVEVAEKNSGSTISMNIKNFEGQYVKNSILPQERIIDFSGTIGLPNTFRQYTAYPISSEINFNQSEIKLVDGPSIYLKDGTDVTSDVVITKDDGRISFDFGDIIDKYPGISHGAAFDIRCNFSIDNAAKAGNNSPQISGTVTYPTSPTNSGATKTSTPEIAKAFLMDLSVFVCNRDSGAPYQGVDFVVSNPNGEWFSLGEPCWVSRDQATVFTTDSSGYININKAVGAGTYILHQLNNANDGAFPLSDQTTINLGGNILFDDISITATAQGSGQIVNVDSNSGQVVVKIELAHDWNMFPGIPTFDKNLLIIVAAIVLLLCSSLIFIQRKKANKKRG